MAGGAGLSERVLRKRVLDEISSMGPAFPAGVANGSDTLTKEAIRTLHARQRHDLLQREHRFIEQWQDALLPHFATGVEVHPSKIEPRIVQVSSDEDAALFRFASLHWSVPVSRGFGRRTRFLVLDDHNNRLIGIFALGDPVYNLTARDHVIGWNADQRNERLYNVLDAFVLGALPPYRQLLGGKLIAMAAVSDTAREMIYRKYRGQRTEILGEVKQSRPVLITTTSALGRSSLYNRLSYDQRLLFTPVGFTRGFGHFQFSEDLFRGLVDLLANDGGVPSHEFGSGPNWRIRTVRVALRKLNLSPDLLMHGIRREVYLAPLAKRWKEYLRGEATYPGWLEHDLNSLAAHFRERWAIPRSKRDNSYRSVRRSDMALLKL